MLPHRLGELQLSIEAYDQAISLDNFFIEAYIGRGNAHMDYLTPGRIIMSKWAGSLSLVYHCNDVSS